MYREHDNKSVISLTGILLVTLLIGASVWIPAYLFENSLLNTTGSGALYRALTPLLTNISTYVPIVAWVVMLGISMAQCWQCAHLRLVKNTSLLPILLNVLLFGVFLSEKGISPGLPASICLYIAFVQMITPCSYEDNLWRMVETGFFVALASLFAPTYVLYIPVCWMGMQMLNKFNFPALLASIIGMMVPYILLFGFWFLTNQSDTIAYQWEVLQHQFCLEWLWTTHETILLIIIGITLLVALMGFMHQHTDRIHPRAVSSCCFTLAFASLLLAFLYHNAHHTPALVLFTTLVLTQYFHYRSKKTTTVFFYAFILALLFVYLTQFFA